MREIITEASLESTEMQKIISENSAENLKVVVLNPEMHFPKAEHS
jgi:hypothetical protein